MKIVLITVGVLGTLVLIVLGLAGTDKLGLKVEATRAALSTVTITNVGDKPITIKKVTINGREECAGGMAAGLASMVLQMTEFPAKLDIGDVAATASQCAVVRVLVESDRGSETYTFN